MTTLLAALAAWGALELIGAGMGAVERRLEAQKAELRARLEARRRILALLRFAQALREAPNKARWN